MLSSLLITSLIAARAFAQDACNSAQLQTSETPGKFSIVLDNDPTFVSLEGDCTSSNQIVIGTPFQPSETCITPIRALCDGTSPDKAFAGSWSWSWMADTAGPTCQVGLFQPLDADNLLSYDCCGEFFEAMLNQAAASTDRNRVSVNIQVGGFPHTAEFFGDGVQALTVGLQVDPTQPSFILQS